MSSLTRRSLLVALAAASAVPLTACAPRTSVRRAAIPPKGADLGNAMGAGLDAKGVAAIAASYAAATGDPVGSDVEAALFPRGAADAAAIRAAAARDFAAGRLFVHAGWRLSHTEGRLFTLLAREY